LVFLSGQIPIVPQTGELIKGGIIAQTRQSLTNIKMILQASGLTVAHIMKTTIFVNDLNDFTQVNQAYEAFFTEHQASFPTRSCVEVARLPKDALIEIEAIACKKLIAVPHN